MSNVFPIRKKLWTKVIDECDACASFIEVDFNEDSFAVDCPVCGGLTNTPVTRPTFSYELIDQWME